jgi:hypothetical protein
VNARHRLVVVATAFAATAAGTFGTFAAFAPRADAQTRGGKPAGRPRPPGTTGGAKADAGAAAPDEAAGAGYATGDGGAVRTAAPPEPPPAPEAMDGGLRASPLNPAPQELPGASNVDAGTSVDHDRLLADIAALRARVAAVSDNLYSSRVAVALQTDGDHGKITRITVSLDDGVVWTAPTATFSAADMTTVYDHAVAPGRHAVTVDVERKDDRDEAFRTSQRSRFTVDVPRDQRVDVQVKILDDSSMGGDFPSDRSGKYDLRFRVKAVAKPVGK